MGQVSPYSSSRDHLLTSQDTPADPVCRAQELPKGLVSQACEEWATKRTGMLGWGLPANPGGIHLTLCA